jgi:cobalt/nickel transport protein
MHKKDILIGLGIALVIALVFSPFASPWPDGLERVAEDKGFLERSEVAPALASPVPDYAWPGIPGEKFATSAAAVAGTLIVFAAGYGVASLMRRQATA